MGESSMEAKRLMLNMNVLKRHDSKIVEIVDSTSYVVLYRYEEKTGQDGQPEMAWIKTGVEGSMFLYKRSVAPLYGFFILNRHSTENFSDELVDENSLELTPEYIISQSADERIHGIWVFEEDHRERIGLRMIELCRLSKPSTSLAKAAASVPVPPSNASPVSQTSSKPVPTGQPISLDMLFGNAQASSQVQQQSFPGKAASESTTSFQPPTAPEQAIRQEHPQGMALLDSLFASMPSQQQTTIPMQASPAGSQRALEGTSGRQQAPAQSDEEDLKRLLGLSTSTRLPVQHQPVPSQSHMQEGQAQSQAPRHPPTLSQQQQQQSYQQAPYQPQQYQQQQNYQQQNYEAPLAPQPQRVPQFSTYESPLMQQRLVPPPTFSQQQQPNLAVQRPPPLQQATQPRGPLPNPHFVPLMPSVLLNKNRSTAQQNVVSPQKQEQSLPAPQSQQTQFYNSPAPPHISRALSPLRQSTTTHDSRLGAQSIPPPPVPPIESRPPDSQVVGQASSPSSAASAGAGQQKQITPLSHNTAMDVLSETLRRSQIYQSASVTNEHGQPPLDRQAFRSQLVGIMQDSRFIEALYQGYLNHVSSGGMTGSLI